MRDWHPGCIAVEYRLCLLIQRDAFRLHRAGPRLLQHCLHLIAAVKRDIPCRFLGGSFAQQWKEKRIRIPRISEPSQESHVMFAVSGFFEIGYPVKRNNLGFNANVPQIGLKRGCEHASIRNVGTRDRQCPECRLKPIGIPGFGEELLGEFWIIWDIFNGVVITPERRRNRHFRRNGCALVELFNDCRLVNRVIDSLPHFQFVKRWFVHVHRKVTDVQP